MFGSGPDDREGAQKIVNKSTPAPLIATGLLLAATTIGASESEEEEEGLPLWEMGGVAFGQVFPAYPGAGDQNLTLLPLPYPIYRGGRLRFGEDFDNIAEGRLIKRDRVKLDLSFNANFPSDSKDIDVREGMPDLDFLVEVGPEVKIKLTENTERRSELLLNLPLRAAISLDGFNSTGRGFVFGPELEYKIDEYLSPRNELSLRWSPSWATRDYMDFFYTVPPEFETAVRPAYEASSGYLTSEFKIGLKRQITDRLRFIGSARVWVNSGAANENGPLFVDDVNWGIRAALIWTFWKSKRIEGDEEEED